jgi:hypothetical protein
VISAQLARPEQLGPKLKELYDSLAFAWQKEEKKEQITTNLVIVMRPFENELDDSESILNSFYELE